MQTSSKRILWYETIVHWKFQLCYSTWNSDKNGRASYSFSFFFVSLFIPILGVYGERSAEEEFFAGLTCKDCKHTFTHGFITNQLQLLIRKHLTRYYEGTMTCLKCSNETNQIYVKGKPRCVVPDCLGYLKEKVSLFSSVVPRVIPRGEMWSHFP